MKVRGRIADVSRRQPRWGNHLVQEASCKEKWVAQARFARVTTGQLPRKVGSHDTRRWRPISGRGVAREQQEPELSPLNWKFALSAAAPKNHPS